MLNLYDTATRSVRELALREPGKVSIYVCGPTVYGPAHLGHGRMAIVFDILRRYLEWTGLDVQFVSNITDIEDKIIERSQRENRPWQDITEKCEAMWWKAMEGINVGRPTDTPHATEYVDEMVEMIGQLVERDLAYTTDDGVYMDVESVDDYGLLAFQTLDDMRSGGGDREVVGAEQKRHPADFVLWKFSKPDEPSWPSPWGDGRPGWHSECVVMSLDLLGEGFDLHCGGQDLRFPHHENERAQAVALGKTFANHWMHNGFVVDAEGEKMSKSIGNVANLLDLIEHYDPRAYRLVLLQSHYRSPVTLGQSVIDSAVKALSGLDAFVARAAGVASAEPDAATIDAFRAAMDDDLDTPKAMSIVFDTVRAANSAIDSGDDAVAAPLVAAVLEITGALGLELSAGGDDVPAEISAKAAALDEARANKDYAAADALRDELQADGWTVETTKDGTTVRR
ncbi:cysteine--tRNA ligase [Ilumatobacter coccineus]|uniref:Cysteine--tRNA ligase n=1 Tax=Ilumatobacter coccineus (strain NBRC 103263 / KCTC 29153 / YM16-304) TaxID=1313172 RepID=A0A6C7EBP2_ILUCY|nr:cysteine--tRNA ligase [Ilumatobacter coccineus]BAN03800.1 cysteinyl-tRNA synthetase [Ilumatobacter coccineus YM16-304]